MMRTVRRRLLALRITWSIGLVVMGMGSCDRSPAPSSPTPTPVASATPAPSDPWFVESAEAAGLVFRHDSGHHDRCLLPEIVCGGAALFDMDSDGDLDAYLIQAGPMLDDPPSTRPPNQLLRNRGDGTFDDVTLGSGADDRGYGMGAATGDFDNDGDVDVYVTNLGPNVLLRNDGQGRFTDVTDNAGTGDPSFSAGAAFLDYDRDGDLDLFVANYVRWRITIEKACHTPHGEPDYCSPNSYDAPARDTLYRNNGDCTFADVSVEAGLDTAFGNGLGVACGDVNGDGWVDIFVANDGRPNQLWINQRDGTFRDRAMALGCAIDDDGKAKAGMGVVMIDIDNDADRDLLVVNLRREADSVYRNDGAYFVDNSILAGLAETSRRFTRFGVGVHDFDNDGTLDLFEVNGRVTRPDSSPPNPADVYAEPNLLWRGTESGRFQEVNPRGGTNPALIATSRAAAFGDINNDGGIDVLVVNRDGPAHLLRNVAHNAGHWIMFRVFEDHGGDALGATLTLRAGQRPVQRDVVSAYSYCAANDPRIHMGLGALTRVDEVTVRWVDGSSQSFGSFDCDRIHVLRRSPANSRVPSADSDSPER